MKRLSIFMAALILCFLLSSLPASAQQCGVHCGTERWVVKTLTDSTVDTIDLTPVSKTINWIRTRARPKKLPGTTRLVGIEMMTFRVRGVVLTYKKETNDSDFHVVIAQPNNHSRTMIVEFPDPGCSDVCSSDFLDQIRQARADFIAKFGEPTTDFTDLDHPVLVEVVGVGFFDRFHGQRGRALPSGIELHPVLKFRVLE